MLLAPAARAEPGPAASPAAPVRVGESLVFTLSAELNGKQPNERAARASAALESVLAEPELVEVRVQQLPDSAMLYAGDTPIVELVAQDAALSGQASLETYANDTARALRIALASERKRSRIAETVFSFSLVVFFALIAFYLIKKVTSITERARRWLEEHGDRNLAISIKSIELVRPAVVKSTAVIALGLAKWLGQFGIFYAWLVVVLSLFETTRGYTERLTGFVLSPLSQLMGRAFAALPLLVVAGFAALAVLVLVRFTGLFLASVARRETTLGWLPADLAAPASVLLRIAIVILALVFAAPVVTGSSDDSLGRAGAIVLCALGLAATPLLATGLLGAVVLFGRRLSIGEHVRIRGQLGRVTAINLLELRVWTEGGCEQRIPHLLLLWSALDRLGPAPRLSVEVLVPMGSAPARVLEVLAAAAGARGRDVSVELVSIEAAFIRYRVNATLSSLEGRSPLLQTVVEALADAGLGARPEPSVARFG